MSTLVKIGVSAVVAYFAGPYIIPQVTKVLPAKAIDSPLAKQAVGAGLAAGLAMGSFAVLGLFIK